MSRPDTIVIDGRAYRWRDIMELRRKQLEAWKVARPEQPALFALKLVVPRHARRAGHPVPTPAEMLADVQVLDTFQASYKSRRNAVAKIRNALEELAKAALI